MFLIRINLPYIFRIQKIHTLKYQSSTNLPILHIFCQDLLCELKMMLMNVCHHHARYDPHQLSLKIAKNMDDLRIQN